MHPDHPLARLAGEALALVSVVGGLIHMMPEIGSALGACWYCLQIYDRFRKGKKE